MTTYKSYVQRVRQVDAVELDAYLLEVLKLQVSKITKIVRTGGVGQYQPEMDLLISFLLWKFSVWEKKATYGQQLLSIRYGDSMSWKKAIAWAVLTIGPKYIKDRYLDIQKVFSNNVSSEWVRNVLELGEAGVQVASFVNLLVFLMRGHYPTLVDRLLSQKVECVQQERPAGYQFLMRQLLWHTLVDMFTFVLPLVNYHYVRRRLRSLLGKHGASSQHACTTVTKCAVCEDSPVSPYHMGCGHVYCYYCLQANYLADPRFECQFCGCVTNHGSSIKPVCQDDL